MDGSENRDCGLFTVLFEQYREPFTRFANSFVRDRAVSENLFVDALVDYWQQARYRCPKVRTSRPTCSAFGCATRRSITCRHRSSTCANGRPTS